MSKWIKVNNKGTMTHSIWYDCSGKTFNQKTISQFNSNRNQKNVGT